MLTRELFALWQNPLNIFFRETRISSRYGKTANSNTPTYQCTNLRESVPLSLYNAVLRSDLWALPALGTGHRLGIQNAPAGGPLQITEHRT